MVLERYILLKDSKVAQKISDDERMCDIIIENETKEWFYSMKDIKSVEWDIPRYSQKQINKAGRLIASLNADSLRNIDVSINEIDRAKEILYNWRTSHAFPLRSVATKLEIDNPDAIVVQRLKRYDSIVDKLVRNENKMCLARMQDLGGCRVILDKIDEVYNSINRYKEAETTYIYKNEQDYIKSPKTSGYRSYHLIYQFFDEENVAYNKNILIEIQFRTKLQHIWATAVEIMGIYTKSQLKASIGNEDILRFFVLASSIFAQMENTPVCPNTVDSKDILIKEMKKIDAKYNIVSMLSAISVAIKHTNEKMSGKGYYLLQLNYNKKIVRVNEFATNQVELATDVYNKIEALNNPDIDAVLVSALSFEEVEAAYPNYFTDISKFVEMMRKLLI